jgi:hypothetical protein
MSKKDRYKSPVEFKHKAAKAQGWNEIADTVRDQIQENCDLMMRKHVTPTKLVGFSLCVRRDTATRNDVWTGNMVLRFNNNLLDKNVLRYNFRNAFRWGYHYGNRNSFLGYSDYEQRVRAWYSMYNMIRNRRHGGLYDFMNTKLVSVSVSFNADRWPGMYYDELLDLIENAGNRRRSFGTLWSDPDQEIVDQTLMLDMAKTC